MAFRGSFVALITPFNKTGGVDRKSLRELVEWHIAEGTDGIVCCGSTGESVCLTESDRKLITKICVETAAKRIPIIVGTGVSSTDLTVRYTEQVQRLGADGCLVVTPFYNKPSQRGCVLHYREVAKVGLPVIMYHNPGRAVVRLSAEGIVEICQIPNIVAVKESTDVEHVRKLRGICPSLPVFSGEDNLTYEIIREGGVGAISVFGNVIPRGVKRLVQLALQGNWEEAKKLSDRYLPLCKALFRESNPQPVKYVVSAMGKCKPIYRLPLVLPTKQTQNELKEVMLKLALPTYQPVTVLG